MEQLENLEEKNTRLEEKVSKFIKLLEEKDALNQDLLNRNRELKAKFDSYLKIKNEFEEDESFLIIGLELLSLLKKRRYGPFKDEAHWLLLYAAIDLLYGDISSVVGLAGLTSQETKVCYLTYVGLNNSEQAEILVVEVNSIKRYKNRIKKKLNVDGKTALAVYLSSLSG